VGILYERAGRLTGKNGGLRPGQLPNALLTPHIAGDADERSVRESGFCVAQALRVAEKRQVLSVITAESGPPLGSDPASVSTTMAVGSKL
jgi:hypothetical protein